VRQITPWDCVEVVAVKPIPNSNVGEHMVTYRMRNGVTRDWTIRAKDELEAFMKVEVMPE
jgi:hypothetical protein